MIQSVLNKTRSKKIQQFAKTERNEHHDGSIQRKNVISSLKKVPNFGCSNFNVRMDRQLGAGSFGVVFACDFGFKRKLQCVIKKSKPGAREELILEGRILLKIFEEPVDWRQRFFPFPYGYSVEENGLVCERFFGLSVKQHAMGQVANNWSKRLLELSQAVDFLHSREIIHLDIHASNVLASQEAVKLIDFGKASLTNFPITYNLTAAERDLYNKRYQQIEYELRNEKLCKTGLSSDVYSIGVLLTYIAEKCFVSKPLQTFLLSLGDRCCTPRSIRNSVALLIEDLKEMCIEDNE